MEHVGTGAIRRLATLPQVTDAKSCLVVADPNAFVASGARSTFEPWFDQLETVSIFDDFTPNPDTEAVTRALENAERIRPDVILGVGGGTAIDIAKLVSCAFDSNVSTLVNQPHRIERKVPLVAIPTTAGTGSEATHFAVLYVDGVKHSIAHEDLLPDVSIVDPNLLKSVPPSVAAHTGLDAICQSIESIWSVQSTPESFEFAETGLRLAIENIQSLVSDPDADTRLAMARAAHLSGKAINVSKTTAAHALSYALTSKFGVPHGLAVALTIGEMLVWNAQVCAEDCLDPRGADHVSGVVGSILSVLSCDTAEEAPAYFDRLLIALGCDPTLGSYGVGEGDVAFLVNAVNAERLANNPRHLTQEDIRNLLRRKF